MGFPYQKPQGNHQNPTLIPNLYAPVASSGVITLTSPAGVISENPLTASSGHAVLSGTITTGDIITLKITNPVMGKAPVDVTYTVLATDTLASIGYALMAAVNGNSTLQRFGFSAEFDSVNDSLYINQASGVGNFSTLADSVSGSATEVLTWTQMSGGSGPVTPVENFVFSRGPTIRSYWFGVPVPVDYATLTALVNQGQPVR